MTIRYTCTGCESVLKIKDEKAGTTGKCPKCKTEFLIPDPEPEDNDVEVESEAVDEPVDMPIELTPEVPESETLDPHAVQGGFGSPPNAHSPSSRNDPAERKPSVAELMKDFEATKKDRAKKSSAEVSRPSTTSAASSAMETSGSAADALSKAYQQKRDASSAPSKTAKEVKEDEAKALLKEFILKKGGPVFLVLSLLLYGYWKWMTFEPYTGLPLYETTGQVTMNGSPAAGVQILFEPIRKDPEDNRSSSRATTDAEGKFRMMYDASHFGTPAGAYNIGFVSASGLPIANEQGAVTWTVEADKPNEFKIAF